jgi:hypothetical protein
MIDYADFNFFGSGSSGLGYKKIKGFLWIDDNIMALQNDSEFTVYNNQ